MIAVRTLTSTLVLSLFILGGATGARACISPTSPQPARHPKKTNAPRISPSGRAALARTLGTGRTPAAMSVSNNDAGGVGHAARPVRTRPLRVMRVIPPPHPGEDKGRDRIPEPVRPAPPSDNTLPDTGTLQTAPGALISAPTATGLSFEGVGVGLGGFQPSSNPPDTNGRVGATQYVQWNNTSFAVFDKTTGALLYGPAAGNTLFQTLGGACASHNDGDPVVAYDILAGRWVLSQFVVGASPSFSHQCVAVSVTGDATGAYDTYDFVTDTTNFVDYPKMGVWPDGYYMSAHVFNAAGTAQVASRIYVFERSQMLLGQPARQLQADLKKYSNKFQYGFLPADVDSLTPPPAGEAEFVLGPDPAFLNRTDSARVAVTWGATPTITLTEATIAVGLPSVAPCVSNTSGQDNRDCVPQPSPAVATDDLDNLSGHYLYRLAYRNFGGSPVQESLVVNGTQNGSASTPAHGALRWFEFRNAGNSTATPTSFQVATYDPDAAYRWMGSIAMDKDHNIALGYSKSSTSVLPGIYMTGRLGTDTVNTMGAETTVQAGAGVQFSTGNTGSAGNRWGDYSAMTLDPVDQCTFYYTNEYLKTNGSFNWSTRIGSYKFPSCTPDTSWGTLTGTITSCATGVPLSGVTVTLSNGFAGATDSSGNYSIRVPAGTYTAVATDADRACSTGSPATTNVMVPANGTVSQSFCMSGASNLQSNGLTIDDSVNGNNNGVINSNECVLVNVGIKNNGCANESNISATLTTSTPGVTITQGSSSYPNLAIDATGTNTTPFSIQTSNAFVCGTIINFTLNLTYASGNKAVGLSVPTCAGGPNQQIPTYQLTTSDLSQTDRIGRDGNPSTCDGKASPGGGFTGTHFYKTWTFTNSGGAPACITVTINAGLNGPGDIESVAYDQTYNPASIDTNYLGDSGISGLGTTVGTASYSFSVPAGHNFVVVVAQTGTALSGNIASSQFSGTVSGFFDFTAGPGACCTPPATPTITPGGPTTFCSGGNVTLTSSSASGNQWYAGGVLIGGATGQQYVASTSGNYTVRVTGGNGCTSASSAQTTVTAQTLPTTPLNLVTTSSGDTQVSLSWGAVTGANSYAVVRNGVTIATPVSNSFTDTNVSKGTTYVYNVSAVNTCGSSQLSNTRIGTALTFTDNPLVAHSTIIKAVHLTELQTAVNAVRAAAGMMAFSFTDPNPAGIAIKAIHIQELRTALDPARMALGLPQISYTNSLVSQTTIVHAIDFTEIRAGVN